MSIRKLAATLAITAIAFPISAAADIMVRCSGCTNTLEKDRAKLYAVSNSTVFVFVIDYEEEQIHRYKVISEQEGSMTTVGAISASIAANFATAYADLFAIRHELALEENTIHNVYVGINNVYDFFQSSSRHTIVTQNAASAAVMERLEQAIIEAQNTGDQYEATVSFEVVIRIAFPDTSYVEATVSYQLGSDGNVHPTIIQSPRQGVDSEGNIVDDSALDYMSGTSTYSFETPWAGQALFDYLQWLGVATATSGDTSCHVVRVECVDGRCNFVYAC